MERKYRLTSRLYYISNIGFYLATLFTLYTIVSDFILTEINDGSGPIITNFSAYDMPVDLHIKNTYADTLISYENKYNEKLYLNKYITGKERREALEVLDNPTVVKELEITKVSLFNNHSEESDYSEIELRGRSSGKLHIKPKQGYLKVLLITKNYILLLASILVLWQMKMFFKTLNKEFRFNAGLSRRLWLIGNTILIYLVGNFILGWILQALISRVDFSLYLPERKVIELYTASIRVDFDLSMAILALGLIIMSKLLQQGEEIQEENELTV